MISPKSSLGIRAIVTSWAVVATPPDGGVWHRWHQTPNEVNLVNLVRSQYRQYRQWGQCRPKPACVRRRWTLVDDFSEIIARNQSNRNFMSGCCYAAWRRRQFWRHWRCWQGWLHWQRTELTSLTLLTAALTSLISNANELNLVQIAGGTLIFSLRSRQKSVFRCRCDGVGPRDPRGSPLARFPSDARSLLRSLGVKLGFDSDKHHGDRSGHR